MHQPLVVLGRLRVLVGDPGHQVQHVRFTEGHRSDLARLSRYWFAFGGLG